jgi:hypothetical protein
MDYGVLPTAGYQLAVRAQGNGKDQADILS